MERVELLNLPRWAKISLKAIAMTIVYAIFDETSRHGVEGAMIMVPLSFLIVLYYLYEIVKSDGIKDRIIKCLFIFWIPAHIMLLSRPRYLWQNNFEYGLNFLMIFLAGACLYSLIEYAYVRLSALKK